MQDAGTGNDDKRRKEQLVEIASKLELFVDQRDVAYARIDDEDHVETWPLEGRRFSSWLAHQYFLRHRKVVSLATAKDAIATVDGIARYEHRTRLQLSNRFAWDDEGNLWVDLADDRWRAVRINAGGWRVIDCPPPLFRRYSHQEAQVDPLPGGRLLDLLDFLNITDDADKAIVTCWTVAAVLPDVARAALIVHGPQGSAKSMLTKLLRALIDPSTVPAPRFPRGDDELAMVLDHHAMIAFDNASILKAHISDTLCRAITGDGFSKRQLYTDDSDIIRQFKRVIVLNGINVPATKPDLLDRSILIKLRMIPEEKRREEDEMMQRFEAVRPFLVGAIYTTLSQAMAIVPDLRLSSLPRMADWTRWCYAIAEALGNGGEVFLEAYRNNRREQNREALESHPLGPAVVALMEGRGEWTSTPGALLQELNKVAERASIDTKARDWPSTPVWVSRRLNEIETVLLSEGLKVDTGSRGKDRKIRIWKAAASNEIEGATNTVDTVDTVEDRTTPSDPDDTNADGNGRAHPDTVDLPSTRKAAPAKASDGNDGNDGICQGSFSHEPARLEEEEVL